MERAARWLVRLRLRSNPQGGELHVTYVDVLTLALSHL